MRQLLLVLSICLFAACSKENIGKNIDVTNNAPLNQTIFADQTEAVSVSFSTTGAWTSVVSEISPKATKNVGWISIDPQSGTKSGGYTMNITLDVNYTGKDRTAEITITCGSDQITVKIVQKGKTADGKVPLT